MDEFDGLDNDVDFEGIRRPRTERMLRDRSAAALMGGHYAHMFREDIQGKFWPYFFDEEAESGVHAKLEGTTEGIKAAEFLLSSISRDSGRRGAVVGALRDLALRLVWDGACHFEICSNQTLDRYLIFPIPYKGFFRLPFRSFQFIGSNSSFDKKLKLIVIPSATVWTLRMPNSLSGASGFRRTIKSLSDQNSLTPKFWYEDMDKSPGVNESGFDFNLFQRYQRVIRGRAKRKWGWAERNYDTQGMTEFYFFYLDLRLEYAASVMRDHIVQSLNKLFIRLGVSARIITDGLHSPSEVMEKIALLKRGDIDFQNALDFTNYKSKSSTHREAE